MIPIIDTINANAVSTTMTVSYVVIAHHLRFSDFDWSSDVCSSDLIFPKLLGMWISKDCVPSSWRPRITTYRIRLFHLRLYHIAYFQTTFFVKILLTLFLTTCYLLLFLGEHLIYNATIDALSSIMTLFFFCELLWNNGHCPLL